MDRRIEKTKTAVFNAMLELMFEKDANKITVLELCRRANINKSTFYLHYEDMNDCTKKIFNEITRGIVNISRKINYRDVSQNPEIFATWVINEIENNNAYLHKFKASKIYGNAIKFIKKDFVENIAKFNGFTKENNYYEYANITFAVGGIVDLLQELPPNYDRDLLTKSIVTMLSARPKL